MLWVLQGNPAQPRTLEGGHKESDSNQNSSLIWCLLSMLTKYADSQPGRIVTQCAWQPRDEKLKQADRTKTKLNFRGE